MATIPVDLTNSMAAMNMTGQYQPASLPVAEDDLLEKILFNFPPMEENAIDDQLLLNNMIEDICTDDFSEILNFATDNELQTTNSAEIEMDAILSMLDINNDASNSFPLKTDHCSFSLNQTQQSPSIPVGSSPSEPVDLTHLIPANEILMNQHYLYQNAPKAKRLKNRRQHSSSAVPVDVSINTGHCQPYTETIKQELSYSQQQKVLNFDATDPKKILICCQPRPKFRPRTLNESRGSTHFIRCSDGVKPEYPTILLSQEWRSESCVNLIEVSLMGVDQQPHAYALENKTSSPVFSDDALIYKNDRNSLLFRITDQDFNEGSKTFQVELIKSRQDDVITKELIRDRQLDKSFLRFVRYYKIKDEDGYIRDNESETYSTEMVEAYGDVEVESMGPRFGPMCGQETMFFTFKGRFLKNDLAFEINEPSIGWSQRIEDLTKNGNTITFKMPAFPCPEVANVVANIVIYYKQEYLEQYPLFYQGSLDQSLASLSLYDAGSARSSPASSNVLQSINFPSATPLSVFARQNRSKNAKRAKRLN